MLLKTTHKTLQQMFTSNFPNTPVFMTFGNNDCKYHNQPTPENDKAEFYSYMYNLWFEDHIPNRPFGPSVK